jgi:hypothetical protein
MDHCNRGWETKCVMVGSTRPARFSSTCVSSRSAYQEECLPFVYFHEVEPISTKFIMMVGDLAGVVSENEHVVDYKLIISPLFPL